MGLEEAFKTIVEKINENFKDGLYDINDASAIVNAVNIVGKALSVVKQPEQVATATEEVVDLPKLKGKK